VGAAWRARYDRLRLNTSRVMSPLGGERFPRGTAMFPTRDQFVGYLERFADRHELAVKAGVRVDSVEPDDGGWRLCTSEGDLETGSVIVATGYANEPKLPDWSGRDAYRGRLLHAAGYRNAEPFADEDVVVVGPGSSGMEIAHDLAQGGAGRVRLAVRSPPNILLRQIGGLPGDVFGLQLLRLPPRIADAADRKMRRLVLGDLSAHGLPVPEEGPFSRLRRLGVAPAIVDRDVIDSIKRGRIEIVAAVDALAGNEIVLADGSRLAPDAVVAATGYRCGLEPLLGHLDVLDEEGRPTVTGGREAAAGLRFVGFIPVPPQMRVMTASAERAAADIRHASP
jgi:cation diffusion facilitator CzcD-associated flavoprotein CzcO